MTDAEATRARVDAALRGGSASAVQLLPLDARSVLELLIRRRDARAVHRALDALDWRWRYGGDGAWTRVPRRVYRFDGGITVVVHRALPSSPWPVGSLRHLARAFRGLAGRAAGVVEAPPEAAVVWAAVEAARERLRSSGRLAALAALATAADAGAVTDLARRGRVEPAVAAALAAAEGGSTSAPSPTRPFAGRVLRALARRSRRWRARATGQPVGHAIVRCRAGGLELLAGPGVFLPRAEGEALVAAAADALGDGPAVVVEAGASCGAQLLPLVRRFPAIQAFGTEVDEEAVRWARRNADRLGLRATFLAGSLLEPLPDELRGRVGLLFANLPSIRATDHEANADAADEAYVGEGDDGLGLHRRLVAGAPDWLAPGAALVLQMAPWQWRTFADELTALGYGVVADPVPAGVAVVGTATWPG